MITNFKIIPYSLRLKKPFSYATLTLNSLEYALLKIEEGGMAGYGEAAVAWDINGETQASVTGLYQYIWPLLEERNIDSLTDIQTLMADINNLIKGNYSLKAGVEAALLDLLGKKKKANILSFFNTEPRPINSQTTLSFSDFDDFLSGDFQLIQSASIKVKCGKDSARERKVLEKIREQFPDTPLNIDVNQGWGSSDEALKNIKELSHLKLSWIEQPLSAHDVYGSKKLTENSSVPIMLDESCGPLSEVIVFMENGYGNMVNIKLHKCGGLLAALDIFKWCDSHNVPYIIGDMIHSQLGNVINLYAGLLGSPRARDLTPLDRLLNDPSQGILFRGGSFIPPVGEGLGISLSL